MKKTIAALLTALMICTVFAGAVPFASADSIEDALADIGRDLYGMYTLQSGNLLRDRYDKTLAGVDGGGVQALYNALNALRPLENYTREPLLGFDGLTADDVSAMPLKRGSVSVSVSPQREQVRNRSPVSVQLGSDVTVHSLKLCPSAST